MRDGLLPDPFGRWSLLSGMVGVHSIRRCRSDDQPSDSHPSRVRLELETPHAGLSCTGGIGFPNCLVFLFSTMNANPTGLEEPPPDQKKSTAGLMAGLAIIAVASVAGFCAWTWIDHHPQSDDAVVTAPVFGIAPRVSGPIVSLPISNNARVAKGEVLFEIDPEPYELAVQAAKANLAAADGELENLRGIIASQNDHVAVVSAALRKAETAEAEARETYNRLLPLLAQKFVTPEKLDTAKRLLESTSAGVDAARAEVSAARSAIQSTAALEARRNAMAASLEQAKLARRDCTVRSPVDALIAGMELAEGAFARTAIDIFKVIDTGDWAVTANFRESQLKNIRPGQKAVVQLMTAPDRQFEGKVESIGWGVTPMPEDPFAGLPIVKRELDWVRLAQKFPVKISLPADVPPDLLRVGSTATVSIQPER